MAALKMGTGITMVVTEVAWRRKTAEIAKLKAIVKEDNKLISELRKQIRELRNLLPENDHWPTMQEIVARCDDQNERLVNLLAEREECVEKVQSISRQIARRVA